MPARNIGDMDVTDSVDVCFQRVDDVTFHNLHMIDVI